MSRAVWWMIGALATAGGCMNDSITGQVDGDADADADADGGANADELLAAFLAAADDRLTDFPGIAIGVVHRGEARVGVRGVLDATSDAPLTTASVFDAGLLLAGILDAIAILEAGIDVDRPVTDPDLVPDLVVADGPFGDASGIAVRHLLNDSSGLTASAGIFGCSPLTLDQFWTDAPLPALLFHPGEVAYGSIWGTSLAGLVLERAEGRPYPEIVHDRVFVPVGMAEATFSPDDPEREYAEPHNASGIPIARDVDCPSRKPTDQVFASIQDVTNLAAWLLEHDDVREKLLARPVETFRPGFPEGFGLFIGELMPDLRFAGMPTSLRGYHATIYLLPDDGFALVVLINTEAFETFVFDVDLLRTALERGLGLHLQPREDALPRSDWVQYAGTYRQQSGDRQTMVVTFDPDEQVLQVSNDDLGSWSLTPMVDILLGTTADWFDTGVSCGSLRFWRDGDGIVDRAGVAPACAASIALFYRVPP